MAVNYESMSEATLQVQADRKGLSRAQQLKRETLIHRLRRADAVWTGVSRDPQDLKFLKKDALYKLANVSTGTADEVIRLLSAQPTVSQPTVPQPTASIVAASAPSTSAMTMPQVHIPQVHIPQALTYASMSNDQLVECAKSKGIKNATKLRRDNLLDRLPRADAVLSGASRKLDDLKLLNAETLRAIALKAGTPAAAIDGSVDELAKVLAGTPNIIPATPAVSVTQSQMHAGAVVDDDVTSRPMVAQLEQLLQEMRVGNIKIVRCA